MAALAPAGKERPGQVVSAVERADAAKVGRFEFFVAGLPVTQGSKSAIVVKGATPRAVVVEGKTKKGRDSFHAWRVAVAQEARHVADHVTTDPVIVALEFTMLRPKSHPKSRRTWPTGARSGDVDKLARAVLDAITGVIVADDSQVVGLSVTKRYGTRPGLHVSTWSEVDFMVWEPTWLPGLAGAAS